jgi:hypothetical protein
MKNHLIFALAACLAAPVAAQTYKWVDERGIVNYGEQAPVGRTGTLVDVQPNGSLEGRPAVPPATEKREASQASRPVVQEPVPQAAAKPAYKGMSFETFIRLQNGMSEGELVLRAGPPDQESVENFRNSVVKSYYYYPTSADPYITVVTLRGGRIANLERTRKTF